MENHFDYSRFNPVRLYRRSPSQNAKYLHKHMDVYPFGDRRYFWQSASDYKQLWQTTDVIPFQFQTTFSPISIQLVDRNDIPVSGFNISAQNIIANEHIPGLYCYEAFMSLATVPTTGCYQIRLTAGTGSTKETLYSDCQYISTTKLENTLMLEYSHPRYHGDIIFETGIKFQYRIPGFFGFLDPVRKDESYKDQRANPTLLSSQVSRSWPVYFGHKFGLPDEVVDQLNLIWSCQNVTIDLMPYGIAEGGKFEFIELQGYNRRGVMIKVEEGLNKYSMRYSVSSDPTKKVIMNLMVDPKAFGDFQSNQNLVPIIKSF